MSRIYAVTEDNAVQLVEAAREPVEGAFASAEEFAQLVSDWPLRRLVEVWNKLPGVRPLSRFENRNIAVQRIWRALHAEQQPGRPLRPARQRRPRETKTQLVLRMLRQPEGVTLKVLMKATQWQAHSVRGFLSRKVAGSLGLPLQSTKRDGQRVYSLPPDTPT
jgi:Protein of unknown function (DUF3489)